MEFCFATEVISFQGEVSLLWPLWNWVEVLPTRETRLAGFEFRLASRLSCGRLWRPAKRKQALLGSNLSRDSRIRRENDSVAPGGLDCRAFFPFLIIILLSCHALKTHSEDSRPGSRLPG